VDAAGGSDSVVLGGQGWISAEADLGSGDDVLRSEDSMPRPFDSTSVDGGAGDDVVHAERTPGGNTLKGGTGNDRIYGGRGEDEISGGGGRDVLRGGPGRDFIRDGDSSRSADRDVLHGGPGQDAIAYWRTRPVDVDLERRDGNGQRGENDRLLGFENIAGGAGGDRLAGTNGPNRIQPNGGPDVVLARGGDDDIGLVSEFGPVGKRPPRRIDLGSGNDHLEYTEDERRVTCGPGHDVITEDAIYGDLATSDGPLIDGTCERIEGDETSDVSEGSFLVDPRVHVAPRGVVVLHVGCYLAACGRVLVTAPRRPYPVFGQHRFGGRGELRPVKVRLPPSLLRRIRRGRPIIRVHVEIPDEGDAAFRVRLHLPR
jgi:Ca2+-binding RTX toxin-like protein